MKNNTDDIINKLKSTVDNELKLFIDRISKEGKHDTPEAEYFTKSVYNYILSKGKRIRPILFVLSHHFYSKDDDKQILNNNTAKASIFLELLQAFFLSHDDIIDNSELRRGEPSLHIVLNNIITINHNPDLGKHFGIIGGDLIFALTIKTLNEIQFRDIHTKTKFFDTFIKYVSDTIFGQFRDMTGGYKSLDDIDKDYVIKTYINKTAKYTVECPMVLGAVLSGLDDDAEFDKLIRFSENIGVAFQLQDDIIGLFGTEADIGKPVDSDILEEKKTLLILEAVEKLSDTDKDHFKYLLFHKRPLESRDLEEIKNIVCDTGALVQSIDMIEKHLNKALQIITELNIDEGSKTLLESLSLQIMNKYLKYK